MDNYLLNLKRTQRYADKYEKKYTNECRRVYPYIQDLLNSIDSEKLHNLTQRDLIAIAEDVAGSNIILSNPPAGLHTKMLKDIALVVLVKEIFNRDDEHRFKLFHILSPEVLLTVKDYKGGGGF